jgi:hydroxymethylglutaryl-CoA synthase
MEVSAARQGIDDFYIYVPELALRAGEFAYLVTGAREGEGFESELGKLQYGLGINNKSINAPCQDTAAMAKNAMAGLVGTGIDPQAQGYVLVGTESQLDLAKATATQLVDDLGNRNVLAMDGVQACLPWANLTLMASRFGEGVLVTSDMAKYGMKGDQNSLSADFTGGSGATATHVGEGRLLRVHEQYGAYTSDTRDFFKPLEVCGDDVHGCMSPKVYGSESFVTYVMHVGEAYMDLRRKTGASLGDFEFITFHVPYPGITKYGYDYIRAVDQGMEGKAKALLEEATALFGRKEELEGRGDGKYSELMEELCGQIKEELRGFMDKDDYNRRVAPSLVLSSQIGNLYSGSAPLALASALKYGNYAPGSRGLGLFYGSGASSTAMVFETTGQTNAIAAGWDIEDRLAGRTYVTAEQYRKLRELGLLSREQMLENDAMDYMPSSGSYLDHIRRDGSRSYEKL